MIGRETRMLLRQFLEQGGSKSALAPVPELSAVRLWAEIRAAGYIGGYSQLKAARETVAMTGPQSDLGTSRVAAAGSGR